MMRALLGAMALSVLLCASACTGGRSAGQGQPESLPDAAGLLRDSAQAMSELNTVRFNLAVDGAVPGIAIRSAEGVLTKDGNVKGKGQLDQGGGTSEFEFVIVNDSLYLKGPTGGFQRLPAAFAATVYDPSKILDRNTGVPAMLTGTTQARTEAVEDVDGTQAYRIAVTVPKDKLTVLLPGVTSDLNGKLWVATKDPKRLLKAKMEVPAPQSGGTAPQQDPGSVTLTLSGFNDPVNITPPG
jgi:lipoprotein LprG